MSKHSEEVKNAIFQIRFKAPYLIEHGSVAGYSEDEDCYVHERTLLRIADEIAHHAEILRADLEAKGKLK